MSEEEKSAIEILKNERANLYVLKQTKFITCTVEQAEAKRKAIETVLSMLKEKDKQINSKNGTINALQCALKERTEERDRKDDIVTKQNKIIDLMAEYIANGDNDEDICTHQIAEWCEDEEYWSVVS